MDSTDLLRSAEKDARALLVAAQTRWDRPVPHCPEWDAAGLVSHVGTVLTWQAAIVTTGERVNIRTIEPAPPENPDSLPAWYLAALERALEVLGSADPDSTTWTFSSVGDRRAGWWRRRLAVEVATHRWDAEHAVAEDDQGGAGPQSIDGEVASAGIGEFAAEFLPRLLAQENLEGITGTLHLAALDGPGEWWIDLDNGGRTTSEPADADADAGGGTEAGADTTIRGTRSDLLLWLQNRGQLETLEISGDQSILDRWGQLSF